MNIRTNAIALSTVIALAATAAFAQTTPATPAATTPVVKETVKTEVKAETKEVKTSKIFFFMGDVSINDELVAAKERPC